jgi:hypothetical protein
MYSPRTSRRCRSLVISMRSRHSRRPLAIQRSAMAFARQVANTLAELIIGGSLASVEITETGNTEASDGDKDTPA